MLEGRANRGNGKQSGKMRINESSPKYKVCELAGGGFSMYHGSEKGTHVAKAKNSIYKKFRMSQGSKLRYGQKNGHTGLVFSDAFSSRFREKAV